MLNKRKIEEDYRTFTLKIEQIAEEEIQKIRSKLSIIKSEAEKAGIEAEQFTAESKAKVTKKKS